MKLGLLTDIHEHVEYLKKALAILNRESVDQIVVLGDIFEMGERIEETCRLLTDANAVAVWGNHDFGLCHEPTDEVRQRYGPVVMDFMTSLRPRLEIGGCLFTHVEPWLDPEKIEDLWYFEGPPNTEEMVQRIFAAGEHRVMFAGHYHRWLQVTPNGLIEWQAEKPVQLNLEQRYFFVINALCQGALAIYETENLELVPLRL